MFRLAREVRFAINDDGPVLSHVDGPVLSNVEGPGDPQLRAPASNSYAGFPSVTGMSRHYSLTVTLAGDLQPGTGYLRNIKDIDKSVRELAIPRIANYIHSREGSGFDLPILLFDLLRNAWPGASLESIRLHLTPFLSIETSQKEHPMIRLSQKFEFAASHRLHNPNLSDDENRKSFGKCNNPSGHGHNYELQVTLTGRPGANGLLMDIPAFERIVASTIIDRFDHKNLNVDVPEFTHIIPSVENIAKVIHELLKPKLQAETCRLASVTVWETSKTWCEYQEE